MATKCVLAVLLTTATVAYGAPAGVPPDPVLRAVDWCNHGYGETEPMLIDCRGVIDQRHRANDGIWGFARFHLVDVVYGDLTDDGQEDALLVVEHTIEPVRIADRASPPPVLAEVWLMQRRGNDLVMYTSESADTMPTSVSIAVGVANVVWRDHGTICEQRWRFGRVGEAALKSERTCRPDRARR